MNLLRFWLKALFPKQQTEPGICRECGQPAQKNGRLCEDCWLFVQSV